MIAADYQPHCAAASRRRNFLAATRCLRASAAFAWRRQRPRVIAAGRAMAGLLAAVVWFALIFALLMVPSP